MKTKIIAVAILLFTVLFINSCEDKLAPLPTIVVIGSSCDTNNITFSSGSNTMTNIINTQCGTGMRSCHSPNSSSGYDYTNYSVILANYQKGWLYGDLFQGYPHQMPLTAQSGWSDSSGCMLAKFKAWMDRGCPQ